ncbi:MAG: 1-(5-phosphoribosyl)-5-[(5-phosphoribosylamino)methylideneamino]imidazole-4-carboxamide isomerase [Schwartzia sp.]|nr:1-(5-phosphoribosyl)-5-[(5-phosphoribosylamino)methylideneamino]imidazole-4-carboxamide isomerase [Schwartzia sp. (in: firmicutes)]
MMIFPAIDLRGGHCVRLYKGDFSKEEIFSDHPDEMAKKWEGMGAKYLHVVDLDGVRGGQSENLPAIREILSSVQIPIELGGGIRTMEQIESILALGVRRVILGSAAVESPELVREAVEKYGERIVVGIDARDGVVAVKGWEESGGVDAVEFAKKMTALGVRTIIHTDISRDGTLSGVNVEASAALAKASGAEVVVSGGVSSMEDIKKVKMHEKDGLVGVIAGKAIYTGALDLSAAIAFAEAGD